MNDYQIGKELGYKDGYADGQCFAIDLRNELKIEVSRLQAEIAHLNFSRDIDAVAMNAGQNINDLSPYPIPKDVD
jgi:hypothetical protein